MAAQAAPIASLGSIAQWMDTTVTTMLEQAVAPMVSNVTAAILPLVTVALTMSLLWYGWLITTGAVPTPIASALRKMVEIVIVTSIAGAGGLYQEQIVGVMLDLPTAVTNIFTSEPTTPASQIDAATRDTATISTKLHQRAPAYWRDAAGAFTFALVTIIVTVASAVLTTVGIVVLITVKVGMGLLAATGPIFIFAWLFESTRTFLKNWIGQAAFYVMYAALFFVIFSFIMRMFGQLQAALLRSTTADEINIFAMLAALVIFILGALAVLSQASAVAGAITGGRGGGISIPFLGKIG